MSLYLTDDKSTLDQQAITLANVDPDLCRHMASLGYNELSHCDNKMNKGTEAPVVWKVNKITTHGMYKFFFILCRQLYIYNYLNKTHSGMMNVTSCIW